MWLLWSNWWHRYRRVSSTVPYPVVVILKWCVHLSRIIALMLGRLRMGVETAIDTYNNLGKQVFSDPKRCQWRRDGKFKATKLEKAIKSVVREETGNSEEPLLEVRDTSVCRMWVYCILLYEFEFQTRKMLALSVHGPGMDLTWMPIIQFFLGVISHKKHTLARYGKQLGPHLQHPPFLSALRLVTNLSLMMIYVVIILVSWCSRRPKWYSPPNKLGV